MSAQPAWLAPLDHTGDAGFMVTAPELPDLFSRAVHKYGIELPDRQLACAPLNSEEARRYFGAMRCAINYAFANRQVIAHNTREAFQRVLGMSSGEIGLRTVYEVAHNIAKMERHRIDGGEQEVCVHRKGATRAFAAGRPEVPEAYREVGQPVSIPEDYKDVAEVVETCALAGISKKVARLHPLGCIKG
ncbi:MAG: RtcB family protein [Akkermansiaceae bacterium]|nr:RtcB family protein [Akkermansiaceae bacterium]